jgi:hypothetical protein
MQVNLKIEGLEKVQKQLRMLSDKGIKDAAVKAINDTAFQVKRTMIKEMDSVFNQVTPYVKKSVWIDMATPERLSAEILPTYYGGKGIDPQKILAAQEAGGPRRDKRVEAALRSVGILPKGMQTVPPKDPLPGSVDQRGNFKGSFIVQLISYFQGFREQGHRANMTDKRKKKLANMGVSAGGYKTINGFIYFIASAQAMKGVFDHKERTLHLHPGIWAKSGIHGSTVKPVMLFTKAGYYKPRFSMERIAKVADVDNYMAKRMRYRIRQAAEALMA